MVIKFFLLQAWRWEREIDERNRPLTDDELDTMFPEGYKVLQPPAGYMPVRTPARKITATPTPMAGSTGFHIQVEDKSMKGLPDASLTQLFYVTYGKSKRL